MTPGKAIRVEELDGLVLGGGADIDPTLYGEVPTSMREVVEAAEKSVKRAQLPLISLLLAPSILLARKIFEAHTKLGPDPARDDLERALLEYAVYRGLPVLGICRGAQLMNVCAGGTLYQDVTEFYVESPQLRTVLPRKRVRVQPGSHLAKLLGRTECAVNALHHQAIRDVANDYDAVATEKNGIIQAIEDRRHAFRIGVQWHPEYLPQDPRQRALFDALVSAARV
jgi:putative glutamine amidotransferase